TRVGMDRRGCWRRSIRPGGGMNSKRRTAALLGLVIAAAAAIAVATASADGRQLVGEYCTNPKAMPKPGACISLSYGGQAAEGYTDSPNRVLTLRPGTYWLSVNDNSSAHNFSLETPDGSDQAITGVVDAPGRLPLK